MRQLWIYFLCVILLWNIQADANQISRLRDAEISNSNIINADDLDAEFNQLINESNNQDTRIDTLENQNMTLGGIKTFTSNLKTNGIDERIGNQGVTIDGVLLRDSKLNASGASPSIGEGEFVYDTDSNSYRGHNGTDPVTFASTSYVDNNLGVPTGYLHIARPVYTSTSTFSVANFKVKNSDDDDQITQNTSTLVNLGTTGINGIAQSDNLSGSAAIASGTSTVSGSGTSFNTDFVVGDVLCINDTSECRRVTLVSGSTSMTVESNWGSTDLASTYKRGGEAPNTWYNLYAIDDGTADGLILSTRNMANGDTLVDLPSGYTKKRQIPFAVRNDSSSNLLKWIVSTGWPTMPMILWQDVEYSAIPQRVLNAGTATTFTAVDLSAVVPPISKQVLLNAVLINAGNGVNAYIRPTGSGLTTGLLLGATITGSSAFFNAPFPTGSNQQIDYKITGGGSNVSLYTLGFIITEVDN